jgi:hypothetical protein
MIWRKTSPFWGFSFCSNFVAMKEWITKLFGTGDEVSSKRVIGTLGALVLFTTMVINSFSPRDISRQAKSLLRLLNTSPSLCSSGQL